MQWRVPSVVLSLIVLGVAGPLWAQREDPLPVRFTLLDNDDAWQSLPLANPPLPAWARTLMPAMPRTTASMLELDELHRAHNPLGSILAGKLRWVAADALNCDYFRRTSEEDLRRASLSDVQLTNFVARDVADLSEPERALLTLARQLTLAAHEVTDKQMADLLASYGPEEVVAIVHTVACANFQCRIALALGAAIESDGPLPPVRLHLDAEKRLLVRAPEREPPEHVGSIAPSAAAVSLPEWEKWETRTVDDLQGSLDQQKERTLRIPLPDPGRFAALPAKEREQAQK
ncbi:MAG: carboxymuconolactone decarboxylase family protein, partial [Pirellulaceae bacterium]